MCLVAVLRTALHSCKWLPEFAWPQFNDSGWCQSRSQPHVEKRRLRRSILQARKLQKQARKAAARARRRCMYFFARRRGLLAAEIAVRYLLDFCQAFNVFMEIASSPLCLMQLWFAVDDVLVHRLLVAALTLWPPVTCELSFFSGALLLLPVPVGRPLIGWVMTCVSYSVLLTKYACPLLWLAAPMAYLCPLCLSFICAMRL